MKQAIKDLLASKKFLVALVAILVVLSKKAGLPLSNDLLMGIVGPLVAFILAQGWADSGKEAAKVNKAAEDD